MITLVYDGACPFCSSYIGKQRLEAAYGPVILLDARSQDPRLITYWQQGYLLDEGMILDHDGVIYFGAEALARIAFLTQSERRVRGINQFLQHRTVSKLLYPLFKRMRKMALYFNGAGPLRQPPITDAIKHKAG